MTGSDRWPVRPEPGEAVPTPFGMSAYCVGDPAAHAPDRDALVVVHGAGDDSRWTFAEVDDVVRAVAVGLLGLGLQSGARVLLRMGNRAHFPFVFFGAIAAGLVAVPTSAQLTADEAAGRGYVRAKTGTLLKVSSLSGVTTTEDGRLLVYSFVVNDLTDLTAAKDMLDRSAAALTRL